jgi:hypothetical protein
MCKETFSFNFMATARNDEFAIKFLILFFRITFTGQQGQLLSSFRTASSVNKNKTNNK